MENSRNYPFANLLQSFEIYISGAFLGLATAITAIAVFLRYTFGYSYAGVEEVIRYLLIWSIFIGGSLAIRKGDHIYVDILVIRLPYKVKKYVQIIACMLGFFFCMVLTYEGFLSVLKTAMLNEVSPSSLRIPMVIPKSSIVIGGLLMAINFLMLSYKFNKTSDSSETISTKQY